MTNQPRLRPTSASSWLHTNVRDNVRRKMSALAPTSHDTAKVTPGAPARGAPPPGAAAPAAPPAPAAGRRAGPPRRPPAPPPRAGAGAAAPPPAPRGAGGRAGPAPRHELHEGDSITFDADLPHHF